MSGKAILIGALDTKGQEFQYVKDKLLAGGVEVFAVNTGILGDPLFQPDVSADEVAGSVGSNIAELQRLNDRGTAISTNGIAGFFGASSMERLPTEVAKPA